MQQLNLYTSSLRKAVQLFCIAATFIAASIIATSCDNDNDEFPVFPLNRPNAIVTVKPSADGSTFYMQLDDSTRLTAANMQAAPYGKREVRAFVNYRLLTQPADKRKYEVYINWMDSVLTKPMIEYPAANESLAAHLVKDPVEIMRDWTVSEMATLPSTSAPNGLPTALPTTSTLQQPTPQIHTTLQSSTTLKV